MIYKVWQRFGGLIITLLALGFIALLVILTINAAQDSTDSVRVGDSSSVQFNNDDSEDDSDGPSVVVIDDDMNVDEDDPDAAIEGEGTVIADDDPQNGEGLEGSVAQDIPGSDTENIASSDSSNDTAVLGSSDSEEAPASLPVTGPATQIASAFSAVLIGVAFGYWRNGRSDLVNSLKNQ